MNRYSIIITTYNAKELLRNTLCALEQMEIKKGIQYEIIIADDGSTDDTKSLMKNYLKRLPLCYIYQDRCMDSSVAKARNKALEFATGNIVVFLDSDCVVPRDYLIQLDRYFTHSFDYAIVGFKTSINEPLDVSDILDDSIYQDEFWVHLMAEQDIRKEILDSISYNGNAMTAPLLYAYAGNLAVPKVWIDKVKGFDEHFIKKGIEDIECVYRMTLQGLKIAFNPHCTVLQQLHDDEPDEVYKMNLEQNKYYNTEIFVKKHPNFLDLSSEDTHMLLTNIADKYSMIEKMPEGVSKKYEIYVHEDVKEIKKILNEQQEYEVIQLYDYVVDSNLDVWIQLLYQGKAVIQYFPVYQHKFEHVYLFNYEMIVS